MKPNVAIDGLAGAGKTTVARELAEKLGLCYLDTGLMYRCVAVEWLRHFPGQAVTAERAAGLLDGMDLVIETRSEPVVSCRMILAGEDITDRLHDPEVSALVPLVAAVSAVRRDLVRRQQQFSRGGGVVMVGRDIATVVMPEARVKIFLVAELHERARRRLAELGADAGVDLAAVQAELGERDRIDTERADSPLICVPDAHRIDTTSLSPAEVLERLAELVAAATLA